MKNKVILIIKKQRLRGLELQSGLEEKGYNVHRPLSIIDAEMILHEYEPHIVIMETAIKKRNGYERIKKYLSSGKLPVILFDADPDYKITNNDGLTVMENLSMLLRNPKG